MFITDMKRIVRSGYTNFMRSGFTSMSSVLIMTITLFVITSLLFVQAALNGALTDIKEKVDVTVYFTPGVSESSIYTVESALKKLPEVRQVTYTSQDDALALFKDKHANDYLTLQALDELKENPLGASLNIKAKDPSQYESIANYFEGDNAVSKGALTIIDKIDYHQNKMVIDRLTSIISGAQRLGFAVSLVFILISVVITLNTIRLIIFMSREEINVMRLVGAGTRYIRGPFIVSGMLVGIVSAIFAILIYLPISIWLGNQMTDFIGVNLFDYYKQNIFQLFAMMMACGIILGSIASSFAIARYLKK
ncbi:MAG: permease-like cell division protein FtsX [Candidatus Paceibacterota bacterium]